MNNIDNSESYATEENLMRRLRKLNLDQLQPLIVCNREGRFTAVFAVSRMNGDLARAARHGFMTIG